MNTPNHEPGYYHLLEKEDAIAIVEAHPEDQIHSFMSAGSTFIGIDIDKPDIIADIKRSYERGWSMHPIQHDFGVCYMEGERKIIRHYDLKWPERSAAE